MFDALANVPWTWLLIRASGITAWGLLTAVVVWGILLRTRVLGRVASPQGLLVMHRWLSALALGFLFVHMALLLIDPETGWVMESQRATAARLVPLIRQGLERLFRERLQATGASNGLPASPPGVPAAAQ